MEEEDGDVDDIMVEVVVGMEEEMEGRMVVKLVEKMEMVGGSNGRPKEAWWLRLLLEACWKWKMKGKI